MLNEHINCNQQRILVVVGCAKSATESGSNFSFENIAKQEKRKRAVHARTDRRTRCED